MRIDHGAAIALESIVRSIFSCERAGMGGYIDADHFESEPFDAALIALAPLWKKTDFHEIEDFLFKWEHILRDNDSKNIDINLYIEELDNLTTKLMQI